MSRTSFLSVCMLACLVLASFAHAGSGTVSGQANQQTEAAAKAGETETSAKAGVSTSTSAEVRAATEQELQAVRQRGAATKAKARAQAEAKLNAAAGDVEKAVTTAKGEADVTARLASEFGLTAAALVAEKQALAVSWGEILIAHTLQANSETSVTVQQVVGLHGEGLGWGQIAAGLGFDLNHVVGAVQSETKVALGRAEPDGKVAVIRGSKLDVGANAKVGANAGTTNARVGASVGGSVTPALPAVKP